MPRLETWLGSATTPIFLVSKLLAWDSLATACVPGVRYDVIGGRLDEVTLLGSGGPSDVCIVSDASAPQATDTTPLPAPGHAAFLLVRGDDVCGQGRYETTSDLRDRVTGVCG